MAWILLIIAGLLETVFAIALKMSEGFTRLWPTVTFAAAAASFTLLSLSLRSLPVGTAYAVWTGLGASGTAVFGMMFLGDPVQVLRIVAIVLILAGVVALQLAGGGAH
ncbi:quaternary ammonium compound-resistance protein SugE [Marinactinospora thermotolerans DSM 45154]|uniref:Quaternary ammonium compound-resistance protein SugE n=1 Tax=Marinactinospora thermotolerans DSM 45154 TaxID=1122192 RepID=A0A1T4QHK9_9ACTN|nr:multidrug efflux SMR transporter [Marinactinospora thermotolerans]SKA02758.1 quaternary ammonium compound-resistance protein SugE [Marinactinospora thermotolerans DSM 45154]